MYAKIAYNADAGNDNEQVLQDLGLLLTGENTLSNLGGNIDLGSSTHDESWEPVSWTIYDTIALNTIVFEVAVHDDAGTKFYVELRTYQTDEIHQLIWESWDTGSNTGTNGTYYTSSNSPMKIHDNSGFTTAPFTVYITATARHMILRSEYGAGSRLYFRGHIQWDRGEAWDTVAAGKRPVFITNSDNFALGTSYAMPHKRSDNAVYTLSLSTLYLATRYGNNQRDPHNNLLGSNSSAARGLDSSSDTVHNMYEIGMSFVSTGERFMTGILNNMYMATYQNGAFGDIVSINAVNYRIWESDANYRIAIRDG